MYDEILIGNQTENILVRVLVQNRVIFRAWRDLLISCIVIRLEDVWRGADGEIKDVMCDEFTADVVGAKSYTPFIIDTICGFANFSICGFRCDWIYLNYLVSRNKLHHIILESIATVIAVLVQQLCHLTGFVADGVVLIVICLDVFKLI